MAVQTTYTDSPAIGQSGQPSTSREGQYRHPALAAEEMLPGKGVVWFGSDTQKVRLPLQNQMVFTLDGDLGAGHTFAVTLGTTPLNGSQTETAISEAFDTDHDTTMTNIKAAIDAITDVTATLTDGTNNREITVTATNDTEVVATVAATATGSGAPTVSTAEKSTDKIVGVSVKRQRSPNDDGTFTYKKDASLDVMREGPIYAVSEDALGRDATIHARFKAGTGTNEERGTIRSSAGSSPAVATAFPSAGVEVLTPTTATDSIAELNLNLPG